MNGESKRIIIYNKTVYELSEEQFEKLIEVKEEANNLPFAGELHVEEHLNFNIDQYKSLGEIDIDFDETYSQPIKESQKTLDAKDILVEYSSLILNEDKSYIKILIDRSPSNKKGGINFTINEVLGLINYSLYLKNNEMGKILKLENEVENDKK
ncbi:hypothetical protein EG346_05915 [Chryseobacterium carnipullorum]|uniref:Uncharacterized protein n=1 Tax=Chryseobacterium carnipullorum TaxID=1124835 RepID=A0A376END6_CHRCU|nr:hypothetical protein [Chryseobacterium carnipullorum]AZA47754.1 hypothetical protein EG346_05915 [Chryseobacterium carnipullorum]AZA67078.1 hypothetical protein EG345_22075 [Chryseobacterium carnipullorum]STD11765.1 Uncharacterised protein [Chryseobacterium carnipullorum]